MTDLDLYSGLPKTGGSLAVWADDARQAASVARSLAPTPFVPQSLRGRDDNTTAANITAAILTGAELGLTPMASLRSIVVIQGTPAMTAVALRGLVQSAGHDIWVESSSDTRAVVCGRRRGSDQIEKAVWTIDRAQKLGLTSKDNWRKQPEAMLVARGTSEVGRRIAADVLLGLPYTVEELADTVETEPQRTARRRAAREPAPMPEPDLTTTTAQRQPPPAAPEPEFDEYEPQSEAQRVTHVGGVPLAPAQEPVQATPERVEDPITAAQLKKLHAALRDAGLSDRDAGLAYISQEIGRDIDTSKDLSKREASVVIDGLGAEPTQEPTEPTFDGMPS